MKIQKIISVHIGGVLLANLIIAGCASPTYMIESTNTAPSQTSVDITSTAEATLVTPLVQTPTLTSVDATSAFFELLANNGGCRLPCFWGISPGKSKYSDAQDILLPLESISVFTSLGTSPGDISPTYIEGDSILHTRVAFLFPENRIVSHIVFQAKELKKTNENATDIFDSPFFKDHLNYYMLPNILTEYGDPTTLMVSTMAKLPSSGVSGGFKVLLLYPDQGILVNYVMQMQVTGEYILGCPSNAHVELELYPSGQTDSFFNLLEPSGWTQIIQNTYKPLDQATSMSQEDFYRIFSQPTDECILTPANLWPIPD